MLCLLFLGNSVLIQSGTCEEYGLSMPNSKSDCQSKGRPVGINDKNVYAGPNKDRVCGCRTTWHKGTLHLHWNPPKSACRKNNNKCDKNGKCVCVSKGMKNIIKNFSYRNFIIDSL